MLLSLNVKEFVSKIWAMQCGRFQMSNRYSFPQLHFTLTLIGWNLRILIPNGRGGSIYYHPSPSPPLPNTLIISQPNDSIHKSQQHHHDSTQRWRTASNSWLLKESPSKAKWGINRFFFPNQQSKATLLPSFDQGSDGNANEKNSQEGTEHKITTTIFFMQATVIAFY